jgi:hypothetical protein
MTLNEYFLEIAYHTKGSIHTIEEDLINLLDMKNGETKKLVSPHINYRMAVLC